MRLMVLTMKKMYGSLYAVSCIIWISLQVPTLTGCVAYQFSNKDSTGDGGSDSASADIDSGNTSRKDSGTNPEGNNGDSSVPERCVRYVRHWGVNRDGLSWRTAWDSVQKAINDAYNAGPGCEVWVAWGTSPAYEHFEGSTITLKDGVNLYGGFNGTEKSSNERDWKNQVTVLRGSPPDSHGYRDDSPIFRAQSVSVVLDGFTITGSCCANGGGLWSQNSDIIIRNCIFSGNTAGYADYNWIYDYHDCRCGSGPAVYSKDSSIYIENSSFDNNSARGEGGAILASGGSLFIKNSSFFSNSSLGHCNYSDGYTSKEILQTYDLDPDSSLGGAVYQEGGELYILNTTIIDNVASDGTSVALISGEGYIINSILWYQTSNYQELKNHIYENESDFHVIYSNVEKGYEGEGNIDANPRLFNIARNELYLRADSPCIDTAYDLLAPGADREGKPRYDVPGVGNSIADMGAYEYTP